MNNRKILFVINNLEIGGIQKSLVNLLNMINNEYDVSLFIFSRTGAYAGQIPKNVKIIEAKSILKVLGISYQQSKKLGKIYQLSKILLTLLSRTLGNAFAINLALCFEPHLSGYTTAISYMHSAPRKSFYGGTNEFVIRNVTAKEKISFVHCDYKNYGGDIDYAKKMYEKYDKIAFCSFSCMNTFLDLVPKIKEKAYVVYNSQDAKHILKQSKQKPILYNKAHFNIVMVSRIDHGKGIDRAIEAISEYTKNIDKKIHLHIVGDGILRDDLENRAQYLQVDQNVTFYGNADNPYRYMVNADLLLMTSRHEAAPMVFGEAQILNLPILTTNTTSAIEMVKDTDSGWICGDSTREIVEAILTAKKILGNNKYKQSCNQPITNKYGVDSFMALIGESIDE